MNNRTLRAELIAGAGNNRFLLALIPPALPDEPLDPTVS
jgi:hypothetical protein